MTFGPSVPTRATHRIVLARAWPTDAQNACRLGHLALPEHVALALASHATQVALDTAWITPRRAAMTRQVAVFAG